MTWSEMVPAGALRLRGENRGVVLATWVHVGLLVLCVAALPFDHRLILGLNPWVKPIKFLISAMIFLISMAVLLSVVGRLGAWRRVRTVLGWGFGLAMTIENVIIAMQSLRGVRSHMNISNAFDATAFGIMGVVIAINTVLVAVLLVLYLTTRTEIPAAVTWGIRLGLFVLVAGSLEGVVMVTHFSHTIGAKDGLAGLPFLNWSTGHGDLRVAHFFALHALQFFTLAGWGLSRTQLRQGLQVLGVFVFAAGYSGMVWWLFVEALAGRALVG